MQALSTRKLGKALGVEAMTLYYYVPNKDAVLDGLVELVFSRVAVEPASEWRAWVRAFAVSVREQLLRHPGLMPVVAIRPVATPGGLRTVERAAGALVEAVAAGLGTPADHQDRFEFALDALLNGLAPRRP